jgi:hypothetical protein
LFYKSSFDGTIKSDTVVGVREAKITMPEVDGTPNQIKTTMMSEVFRPV